MTNAPVARGDRVDLRRIASSDLATCARFPFSLSGAEALTDLPQLHRALADTGFWTSEGGALAIVTKQGGRLVGTVQFCRSSPVVHGYEVGYLLHDQADRGQGYASQALRLFTALLFAERPACHRIQLIIDTANSASWRLAESSGYRREGMLRSAGFNADDPEDCFIYSRVRKDL